MSVSGPARRPAPIAKLSENRRFLGLVRGSVRGLLGRVFLLASAAFFLPFQTALAEGPAGSVLVLGESLGPAADMVGSGPNSQIDLAHWRALDRAHIDSAALAQL